MLANLKYLFLNDNPGLGALPLCSGGLLALNCSNCGLQEVPRELLKYEKLERLWLHNNKLIHSIPKWISELTRLKVLSCFACSIWLVPMELSKLTDLEE